MWQVNRLWIDSVSSWMTLICKSGPERLRIQKLNLVVCALIALWPVDCI